MLQLSVLAEGSKADGSDTRNGLTQLASLHRRCIRHGVVLESVNRGLCAVPPLAVICPAEPTPMTQINAHVESEGLQLEYLLRAKS